MCVEDDLAPRATASLDGKGKDGPRSEAERRALRRLDALLAAEPGAAEREAAKAAGGLVYRPRCAALEPNTKHLSAAQVRFVIVCLGG